MSRCYGTQDHPEGNVHVHEERETRLIRIHIRYFRIYKQGIRARKKEKETERQNNNRKLNSKGVRKVMQHSPLLLILDSCDIL